MVDFFVVIMSLYIKIFLFFLILKLCFNVMVLFIFLVKIKCMFKVFVSLYLVKIFLIVGEYMYLIFKWVFWICLVNFSVNCLVSLGFFKILVDCK